MRVSLKHIQVSLLLLAVSFITLLTGIAHAAEKGYDSLASLSLEDLYKKGKAWHDNNPDSAMVCYSLIESRYSPKMTDEEKSYVLTH